MRYTKLASALWAKVGNLAVGIGAVIFVLMISQPSSQRSLAEVPESQEHQIPDELACFDCTTEAAAYAAAVVNLQVAQEVADETWEAYYECMFGDDPNPGPEEELVSILED